MLGRVLIIFLVLLTGCRMPHVPATVSDAAARGARAALKTAADVTGEPNQYDLVATELKAAEAELGKAAAKRYLAQTAGWMRRVSVLVILASVAGLIVGGFFGGVGRRGCLFALAVGVGGLWLGYFIVAHGYLVGEFISWCAMAAIGVALPLALYVVGRGQWDAHVGRKLAAKRAEQGIVPLDAISKLAVPQSTRSKLADAATLILSGGGDEASRLDAASILRKFRVSVAGVLP